MDVHRTAKPTKVETLPEEEQVFLARCADERMAGAKACALYEEKFGKHLAPSTYYSWISRRWLPNKIAAEQAVAEAREFVNLRQSNPEIPEDVLLRGFLRQRQASPGFREGLVDPVVIIDAELKMRRLDIEERKAQATDEKNKLLARQVEIEERRTKMLEEKFEQSRKAMEEATNEAAEKTGQGKSVTLDDINRIRERTFGLPPIERSPASGSTN